MAARRLPSGRRQPRRGGFVSRMGSRPAIGGFRPWLERLEDRRLLAGDVQGDVAIWTGAVVGSLTTGDLDGDGDTDLLVANDYFNPVTLQSSLAFVPNLGNGEFGTPKQFPLADGTRPQSLFVGDLDGSGGQDLVVAAAVGAPTQSLGAAGALLTYIGGDFSQPPRVVLPCAAGASQGGADRCDGPIHVTGGVLVRDHLGPIDVLVTANFRSDNISILLPASSAGFTSSDVIVHHLAVGKTPVAARLGAIDDDNFTDIAVANLGSGTISILQGDGSGGFTLHGTLGGMRQPADILLRDLDGDNVNDLVVADYSANQIKVFLNQGDGRFDAGTPVPVGKGPQSLAAGDLDGDGNMDLAVANSEAGTLSVLLGDGRGHFVLGVVLGLPSIPQVGTASGPSPQGVIIEDLDGMGKPDVAVAHFLGGASIHFDGIPSTTVDDIPRLCSTIRAEGYDAFFDLNLDQLVNLEDMKILLDRERTTFGDANLDGIFNSRDLVSVFAAGEYEDGVPGNSIWETGDWSCNGDFTSGDLMVAFQAGGYVAQATRYQTSDLAAAIAAELSDETRSAAGRKTE